MSSTCSVKNTHNTAILWSVTSSWFTFTSQLRKVNRWLNVLNSCGTILSYILCVVVPWQSCRSTVLSQSWTTGRSDSQENLSVIRSSNTTSELSYFHVWLKHIGLGFSPLGKYWLWFCFICIIFNGLLQFIEIYFWCILICFKGTITLKPFIVCCFCCNSCRL